MAIDEEEEQPVVPLWPGWSLQEEFVDYLIPKETELEVAGVEAPSGVPSGALLAVRRDADCFTLRSTWLQGPRWDQVVWRTSVNKDNGTLVADEAIYSGMEFEQVHRKFEPMAISLETRLWYMPEPVHGDHRALVNVARVETPSKAQVRDHELQNHAVYRSWCPVCIEARSTGSKHRRKSEEEKAQQGPSIHADFYFMESAPFLALKSVPSGRLHGVALPDKSNSEYVQKAFQRFVEESGQKRVLGMSDNEPALLAIKEAVVQRLKGIEMVPKQSPVGDHRANGSIEVAVRELKRQMRAFRLSLESKIGVCLSKDNPLLAWVASFAAEAINVHRTDASGKTAYEKEFGRRWDRPSLEFGEQVYIKEAVDRGVKLDWSSNLVPVRFVGHHARTNSILGLTEDGLKIGAAVKRAAFDERWSSDGIEELKGLPWDIKSQRSQREATHVPRERPRLSPPDPYPDARALYIKRKDVEQHGYTPGCPGCKAAQDGKRAVAHNEDCRKRVSELINPTRVKEHAERVAARSEAKREMLKRQAEEQEGEGSPKKVLVLPEEEADKSRKSPEGESQVSSPKKRKGDGQSRFKRIADEPVEQIDPSAVQTEVVVHPVVPEIAVPTGATTLEDVLGGDPGGGSSSGPTSTGHGAGGADISSLDILDYEITMSSSKWRNVEALDSLKRKVDARKEQLGSVDVVEVFSPPRFTAKASSFGLNPGYAVDLTTGWDLSDEKQVLELYEVIDEEDPYFLTGSPRCDPFSVRRGLNWRSLDEEPNVQNRIEGVKHLHLCCDLYEKQLKKGKYFLHEHPAGADSWDDPRVVKLQNTEGVFTVSGPMCRWGMALDAGVRGAGKVYKPTRWMTNSAAMASILDCQCSNRRGGPIHRHISLVGGLAHLCAKYPDELVNAVLEGIKRQMMLDGALSSIEAFASGPDPTEDTFPEEMMDYVEEETAKYYDDVSGEPLPTAGVQEARREEIGWVHKINLYTKVPRSQAISCGIPVLPIRWVDVNKGDKTTVKLRSRLVGKELKCKTREALLAHELFSATPPWEMVKGLLSLLVTDMEEYQSEEKVLGIFDISRAHFMPMAERELYIEVPDEDKAEGEGDVIGQLNRNMYGFRDAASGWMKHWQKLLKEKGGYVVGEANPALFYNPELKARGAVHGDDFYVLGSMKAVDAMRDLLQGEYSMRESHRLGFADGCTKMATILNRAVALSEVDGRRQVRIDPDRRHVELIVQTAGMSLGDAKGVLTPAVKPTDAQVAALQSSPELGAIEASKYRSAVMRASFLSQERSDISEAVKRMAQGMAKPRQGHWELLKRLARYLVHKPDISLIYKQQRMPDYIRIAVDSDFAGDKLSRKSTTGMVQMLGTHVIRGSSNLQGVLGLNVSEAEYYALVHGASYGLGLQAYFQDLNLQFGLVVESDSSSAKAFASRIGLGKQRHVMTRFLWLQQAVAQSRVVVRKIGTKNNPADVLTKPVEKTVLDRHMEVLGLMELPALPIQRSIFGPDSAT